MDRIDGPGHVSRRFVSEDAGTNRPPTMVTADWLNGVQEEIVGLIEDAGITPLPFNKSLPMTYSQVRDAVVKMILVKTDAFAEPSGTSSIGHVGSFAGSAPRTLQSKARDRVSARDFYANGVDGQFVDPTGDIDSTFGIQAAVNTEQPFDLVGKFKISQPIVLGSTHILGSGSNASFGRAIIEPTGNFPAFINLPGSFVTFEVEKVFIDYGATVPGVALGNDQKRGFYFTGASQWPQFMKLSQIAVRGGWHAFYDESGSYQSILEQVFSWNCKKGFYKRYGTTLKFDTCNAVGGENHFVIRDVLAPTLLNCGSDQAVVVPGNAYGSANYFEGARGLTISGWDAEGNVIAGNGLSYMKFNSCVGKVSGLVGFVNEMSCAAGEEVYFLNESNASRIEFSGIKTANQIGDLKFTGTGGNCFTILSKTASEVLLSASEVLAPTGGAPTNRYSVAGVGGNISYVKTAVDGNVIATDVDVVEGVWSPVLAGFTTTGVVSIFDAKFSKRGKLVTFQLQIQATTIATTAVTSKITGLPYPVANPGSASAITGSVTNASAALIYNTGVGVVYPPSNAAWGNALIISGSYFTS